MLPTLFKYHKCGDLRYLRELLESNSFYMASRKKMNDMFDCYFSLSENYVANELAGQVIHELSPKLRKVLVESLHLKIYQDFDPGITCFSEKPDNDILWSYYTDSSKGVCLEFDFNNDEPDLVKSFRKVIYTDDFTIETKEGLDILPFRKKEIYSNELEWRIVFNRGNQKCEFKKSSLKAVYIGVRCKQEEVLEIMSILDTCGYSVKYYKMRFTYNSNHITFSETNRSNILETWPTLIAN
jgi:Protein of unknown function (DUF2971)